MYLSVPSSMLAWSVYRCESLKAAKCIVQPSSFEIVRRPISKLLTIRRDGALAIFRFSGIVLCFGGGVLISTVFIHMLGEVCRMNFFEEDDLSLKQKKGEGVPGACLQHGDDAVGIVGVGISVRRAAALRRLPPHPPHRVGGAQDVWRGRST